MRNRSKVAGGGVRARLSIVLLVAGLAAACGEAAGGGAFDMGSADMGSGDTRGGEASDIAPDESDAPGTTSNGIAPSTAELAFDSVAVGESAVRTVGFRNDGAAPEQVERVVLTGDPAFAVAVSGETLVASAPPGSDVRFVPPIAIAPGESLELAVTFAPTSEAPAAATLQLVLAGEADQPAATVALRAEGAGAVLALDPERLDFGAVPVGTTRELVVAIRSLGSAPVVVTDVAVVSDTMGDAFRLTTASADPPLTLEPNRSAELRVEFGPEVCPSPGAEQAASLRVTTEHGDERYVPLAARCVGGAAPVPAIVVEEGAEVAPQTTLHLVGDRSGALAGRVRRWEWRVDQPRGYVGVFMPSSTFPNPTFEVNVVGTYTFYLDVWDEENVRSAEPAVREVVVVPTDAVHVELLWITPGDPDETDTGPSAGSDVDLHFVHPDAPGDPGAPDRDGDGAPDPWFDIPLDCNWYNPHPDWGTTGDPTDDPGLDRDDTDGAGPEIVNLAVPEEGARYRLAVHVWDDHGYGASFVSLRVYLDGALAWEETNVRLVHQDLWSVGDLDVGAGTVVPCEAPDGGGRCVAEYMPLGFTEED